MAGLFNTPEEIQSAEREASFRAPDTFGLFAGLGNSLGNAFQRGAFDVDTRSNAVRQATEVQGIVKGTNFNDPVDLMKRIGALNNAGYTDQAFKFLSALPPEKVPPKKVVDEFIREETVGGTTKRFLFQRDNFNFLHKVGEVSDKVSPDSNVLSLSAGTLGDVNIDEQDSSNIIARLVNRPEFEGLVDTDDAEDFKPLLGDVKTVANRVKKAHVKHMSDLWQQGKITKLQLQSNVLSADGYLREGFRQYVAGGGLDKSINKGLGISGADVEVSGVFDAADLPTLKRNELEETTKNKAIARVAGNLGQLVQGDPKTGEFRLDGLKPRDAQAVFGDVKNLDDAELQKRLEDLDFSFNKELADSHKRRWQLMRENPEAVNMFLFGTVDGNASGLVSGIDDDLREAMLTEYIDNLEDSLNFQDFAQTAAIFAYMRRLQTPVETEAPFTATDDFTGP